jgi:hypothetical protein
MTYELEFPHLAQVTNNMEARLIYAVGQNLQQYNTDVRIDYERWICFETEYGEWSERTYADAKDGSESWAYQTAQR